MMEKINPSVLLISDKFDFSTDQIVYELHKNDVEYLRLNKDELSEFEFYFDPFVPEIEGSVEDLKFSITEDKLKSIYFRAPTFIREVFNRGYSAEQQLEKTQWISFVRSLIVFENTKWVNHPVNTFQAEVKPFQLKKANQVGFNTPETTITNSVNKEKQGKIINDKDNVAVKSIDTALIDMDDKEGFIYTNILPKEKLQNNQYKSPFFLQEAIEPKVDIRATVVNDEVFSVKILNCGDNISGDWRQGNICFEYEVTFLPQDIDKMCIELLNVLGLNFGAIDFVLKDRIYYFIEINPTGEWGWLTHKTDLPLNTKIASLLT